MTLAIVLLVVHAALLMGSLLLGLRESKRAGKALQAGDYANAEVHRWWSFAFLLLVLILVI